LEFCLFSIVYRSVCLASPGFACQENNYHRYIYPNTKILQKPRARRPRKFHRKYRRSELKVKKNKENQRGTRITESHHQFSTRLNLQQTDRKDGVKG
jgi:hypothetical protein